MKTTKIIYPQIYGFTAPRNADTDGYVKIGYTEKRDVRDRIREETNTAGVEYELIFAGPAIRENGKLFTDKNLHKFMVERGHYYKPGAGDEWLKFDDPDEARELYEEFRRMNVDVIAEDFTLRDSQEQAISETIEHFSQNLENPRFLWNAKPRFGKTLTAYELVLRMNSRKTLVLTNRPGIGDSWYADFAKFIAKKTPETTFIVDKEKFANFTEAKSRDEYIKNPTEKIIAFYSLQNVKGAKKLGGKFSKLDWIADTNWDLIIIDEAHEGIGTDKGVELFEKLKTRATLYLSGTPFKMLANNQFSDEQIFNWSYLDEQQEKDSWNYTNGDNPYEEMPRMNLFSYKLADILADKLREGLKVNDGENIDFAFSLKDFLEVKTGDIFVHEDDVREFLKSLTEPGYPFSPENRKEIHHTFWMLPFEVKYVRAMKKLLEDDEFFGKFKVVEAAGAEMEDEDTRIKNTLKKVRHAIKHNEWTITLSVDKLSTGITVPEWTGIFMLNDMSSAQKYFQAIFRAQNPWKYTKNNGEISRKTDAYVFDFAPDRTLEQYAQFAEQLVYVDNQAVSLDKEAKIRELLNFFPVLARAENGEMIELDARKVLEIPKAYVGEKIVRAGFMSNNLFENITGIFSGNKQLSDIISKISPEENKKIAAKRDVKVNPYKSDENGKAIADQDIVIATTNGIFGDKVYQISDDVNIARPEEIIADATKFAEENIAKIERENDKGFAKPITKKEKDEAVQKIREEIVEAAKSSVDSDEFAKNVNEIVRENVEEKVADIDKTKQEKKKKTTEDDVRDHLRGFARTLPMFLMAYGRADSRIENLDEIVPDNEFLELTSITTTEFRKLRDGFNWVDDDGANRWQPGVFAKENINAGFREFLAIRARLANYFAKGQTEDIFDYIPPQKTNQIFTPRRVVHMMLDALAKENPGIFANPNTKFFDPYTKSGMYLAEIVKRLNDGLREMIPNSDQRIQHILANQVFAFAPSDIIKNIAKNYLYGFDGGRQDYDNIRQVDLVKVFNEGGSLDEKIRENWGDEMKFDVVIGNPPYNNDNHLQLYPNFYLEAQKIADIVEFIFPTGWRQPIKANGLGKMNVEKVKRDKQIVFIDDRQNVFPNVSGLGWVNIILWMKNYDNGLNGSQKILTEGKNPRIEKLLIEKSDIAKPQEIVELAEIVMNSEGFRPASEITSVRKPYGLSTDVISDAGKYGLPPFQEFREKEDDIKVYGKVSQKQVVYIPKNYPIPKKSIAFNKWKIFVAYAWGNMSEKTGLGGAYSDIIVAKPTDITIETSQESGAFDDFAIAQKHAKYLMTKFARALLYFNKHSQHSTTAWGAVPIQDFRENWWDESIAQIDEHLFVKYNVPENIREFVRENIQTKSEKNIVNFGEK